MIRSPSNAKVKLVRALRRRAIRQQEGLVVAEGARLIEEILRTGASPVLSFCTAAGQQDPRIAALFPASGPDPLLTTPAIMKAMSDTVTPPGILAVFPAPTPPAPANPTLILILDQVREPGNLGTILRSALAAGVDRVLPTPGSGDPLNPKALRAGMGAQSRLPVTSQTGWAQIEEDLAGTQVVLADPRGAEAYDAVDWTLPSALIVGGEAHGATNNAFRVAQRRVAIPMARDTESLNTATAAGIVLFEAARQRRSGRQGSGVRDQGLGIRGQRERKGLSDT